MLDEKLEHARMVRGIAKGAGIVFFSIILSRIFGFIIRALIGRHFGPETYGLLSTTLTIFTILYTISMMGFKSSLSRQISYYYHNGHLDRLKFLVVSALCVSSAIALLLGLGLFSFSESLASNLFNNQALIPFFKFFAVGLIFFVWMVVASSVYRGFKQMFLFTLFQDLLRFLVLAILIIIAISISAPKESIGLIYLISYLGVGASGIISVFIYKPIRESKFFFSIKECGQLLSFSIPLLFAGIFYNLLFQIDILMIGYFLGQTKVGIYNSAIPVGQLLTLMLASFTPFLLPAMTEYVAKSNLKSLSEICSISTKWMFLNTIPIFFYFLFFSEFVISVIFGSKYVESASVLRIVAVGFLFTVIAGPTVNLLISLGKVKLHFYNNFIILLVNIFLNYFLIPKFGIIGGGIATTISLILLNTITLIQVHSITKIQPFSKVFAKILLIAAFIGGLISFVLRPTSLFEGITIFLVYIILYFLSLKFTKCFDPNDQIIIIEIEKRTGKSLMFLKKILNI